MLLKGNKSVKKKRKNKVICFCYHKEFQNQLKHIYKLPYIESNYKSISTTANEIILIFYEEWGRMEVLIQCYVLLFRKQLKLFSIGNSWLTCSNTNTTYYNYLKTSFRSALNIPRSSLAGNVVLNIGWSDGPSTVVFQGLFKFSVSLSMRNDGRGDEVLREYLWDQNWWVTMVDSYN